MSEDNGSKRFKKLWESRSASQQTSMTPIFVNGSWLMSVARGNKRELRVLVPTPTQNKDFN